MTTTTPASRLPFDTAFAAECLKTPPPEALQEDFIRYAADLAWWGERLAESKREVALCELAVVEAKAAADVEVRAELEATKRKATVDAIDMAVRRSPGYVAAQRQLIEAEFHEGRVRAVVDGLRAKRDMLVGLGAQFRAELNGDPVLKYTPGL